MVRRCNTEKDKEIQKLIAVKLGPKLIQDHGMKKHYNKKEIDKSARDLNIPIDYHCWAYVLFMDHALFDLVHQATGEVCDYVEMKTDMLNLLPSKIETSWFDFNWDLSDLDVSKIFNLDVLDILD